MSLTPGRGLKDTSYSPTAGAPARQRRQHMGQPVVHFEIIGTDPEKLQSYYSDLFGWQINSDNPMNYGSCSGTGTSTPTASESAAASVAPGPTGIRAMSPS